MKTIYLSHSESFHYPSFSQVMALGFFDGVHLGHQCVIQTAIEKAREYNKKVSVMTFDVHPSVVLGRSNQRTSFITPLKEKEEAIRQLGVDFFYILEFDRNLAQLSPEDFVHDFLLKLGVDHVVAGFDYTYGHYGKGTMATIRQHSRGKLRVTTVKKVEKQKEKISSTLIRDLISNGYMAKVTSYLGRYYKTTAIIEQQIIHFRSSRPRTYIIRNMHAYLLPNQGVYEVKIKVGKTWHRGLCRISNHSISSDPTLLIEFYDERIKLNQNKITIQWLYGIREIRKLNVATN
ncbi:FAD synthetase family protein [Alkalihalobacillus sp. BA299]|uniref:FAD synthetase family protein n=1 Tax=Alkalihalobacillus sp. BA299 TaxID=2815938 RepID=UPI001ADB94E6|nr:FAD synthetase family protein [Alkalihalobacillus sp. BA299]